MAVDFESSFSGVSGQKQPKKGFSTVGFSSKFPLESGRDRETQSEAMRRLRAFLRRMFFGIARPPPGEDQEGKSKAMAVFPAFEGKTVGKVGFSPCSSAELLPLIFGRESVGRKGCFEKRLVGFFDK